MLLPILIIIIIVAILPCLVVLLHACILLPLSLHLLNVTLTKLPQDLQKTRRTAIIYGMCRNAMPGLGSAKKNFIELSRYFEDVRFVVMEDSSTDGTKEFLTCWAQEDNRLQLVAGDSVQAKESCTVFQHVKKSAFSPSRISRYAYLRNQLHKVVVTIARTSFATTHFVSSDMDQIRTIDQYGFWNAMNIMDSDQQVIAVSALGKRISKWKPCTTTIYDTYAFSDKFIQHHNMESNQASKAKYIKSLGLNSRTNLIVDSNFGGLCIYRATNSFCNNFYTVDVIPNTNEQVCLCEHTGFHRRLHAESPKAKFTISFDTMFVY